MRLIGLSLAALGMIGACTPISRPAETPIPMRTYGNLATANEIFVLLPGLHDEMDSFEKAGFLDGGRDVSSRRKKIAFVAVDAHFGYYRDRSIDRRLKEDVLDRFTGKKVTLVGVSLGGFGALVTARRHTGSADRIVLLAPFLGRPEDIKRITRDSNAGPSGEVEAEIFAVWRWLKSGADGIPIALLYGRNDRFSIAYDHLASTAHHIDLRTIQGGHDWRTWNRLWADWMAVE
jgi:pimeloyl-ACP methyl ester carboxylesterase